jgi:hypothetical protein
MLALYDLNLYLYIFFMDHGQKVIININMKTKKNLDDFFIHTYTHQTQ